MEVNQVLKNMLFLCALFFLAQCKNDQRGNAIAIAGTVQNGQAPESRQVEYLNMDCEGILSAQTVSASCGAQAVGDTSPNEVSGKNCSRVFRQAGANASSGQLTAVVTPNASPAMAKSSYNFLSKEPANKNQQAVQGVGDVAFSVSNAGEFRLVFLKGKYLVNLSSTKSPAEADASLCLCYSMDQLKALAKEMEAKLP
jgi:hypothetical protein